MCLEDIENVCFAQLFGCNGGGEDGFLGDNVSLREDSPVCSVAFLTKELRTQVRLLLLRIFWGEGRLDVGVRVRHVEGEGHALYPTS